MSCIRFFQELTMQDVPLVGGKNASLGEMIQQLSAIDHQGKLRVPDGFATTVLAYWDHLEKNELLPLLKHHASLLTKDYTIDTLQQVGSDIRTAIYAAPLPIAVEEAIKAGYTKLCAMYGENALEVAIRSSATAEDLPHASFAGQQDTFLYISGIDAVLDAVKKCMASLFTDRAIVYRIEQGFDHFAVGLSVGIQKMVRSDTASSGVAFSLDTDTGYKDAVVITSSYGLGENIVKGIVNPDEYHVHKPTLLEGYAPIIKKYLGDKAFKLIYQDNTLKNVPVSEHDQNTFSLSDELILELAHQVALIEQYYSDRKGSWSPMDVEWAQDGVDKQLYIVQARPETVHSQHQEDILVRYALEKEPQKDSLLVEGLSVGQKIACGTVRVLTSLDEHATFNQGDILVTKMTDPDWVPLMKKAAAIITDKGGRTCHAAIVSRELGIPAVIGTKNATSSIAPNLKVTVDASHSSIGYVYQGAHNYTITRTRLTSLPKPQVPILVNIADPDRAYKMSFLPVDGVGLARVEFIITSAIKVHPMAICSFEALPDKAVKQEITRLSVPYNNDPHQFFVSTLAQGIGTIAAAFYPRPVVVRLSDFKSNEYRNLLGGRYFEPVEENPMLGFRGAVRYCDPVYKPAFALECEALLHARNVMGFSNIKVLVPFVRTVHEAECTLASLAHHGLKRGERDLEIHMMCEVPSNVILLEEFATFFDGFSIGSNDLAQFTLAVDRDSEKLSELFNEQDPAVKKMLNIALSSAQTCNKPISICGQAPSDFPDIAQMLINQGISALSLNPDSVIPFLARHAQDTTKTDISIEVVTFPQS